MIFVDTGAFVARYLEHDQFHKKSLALWKKVQMRKTKCLLSILIINETATLLERWAGTQFAVEKINKIYESPYFDIIRTRKEDELAALQLMAKYADKSVGFTDAVSFLLMRENKIDTVFSFDNHFKFAGFQIYS